MIAEYLEAEHKGGGKDYINIEVRVKADCVHAFASSVRDATIDLVLDVIDEMERDTHYVLAVVDGKANGVLCNSREVRDRILALKGGDKE